MKFKKHTETMIIGGVRYTDSSISDILICKECKKRISKYKIVGYMFMLSILEYFAILFILTSVLKRINGFVSIDFFNLPIFSIISTIMLFLCIILGVIGARILRRGNEKNYNLVVDKLNEFNK
jgi:hypothetical protein